MDASVVGVTAAASPRRWRVPTTFGRGLLGIAALFVLLEVGSRSPLIDPRYFPYASDVMRTLGGLLVDGAFLAEVGWTMWAWLIAMAVSIVVAVPLGVAIGVSPLVHRATQLPIEFLRPLPAVALIPLAILVWGAGTLSKVLLALMATLWPILFNTSYGTHDVDPVARETARSFALPRRAVLLRVILPSAAPFILTGVRISASLALIVLVGLELVAGTANGIGAYILQASLAGNMTVVLAGALVAGLVGIVINTALATFERRAFAWARAGDGEQ